MTILTDTFAALGDPVRFSIVERLLDRGSLSAGQLQDVADISAPAISRHLKVLREAGIVTRTTDKQRRIYSINPAAVRQINQWTIDHATFWAGSLDRLEIALQDTGDADGNADT